jgi:hypothetical protein
MRVIAVIDDPPARSPPPIGSEPYTYEPCEDVDPTPATQTPAPPRLTRAALNRRPLFRHQIPQHSCSAVRTVSMPPGFWRCRLPSAVRLASKRRGSCGCAARLARPAIVDGSGRLPGRTNPDYFDRQPVLRITAEEAAWLANTCQSNLFSSVRTSRPAQPAYPSARIILKSVSVVAYFTASMRSR